jgi:hypothetical protein
MLKKILKIALIAILSLVGLFLLALLTIHLITPLVYDDFFSNSEQEYATPGLGDGAVPQGYTYIEEKGLYLMCAYMTNGDASRIYITKEGDEKNSTYVRLVDANGNDYTGHTGGITSDGKYVWLANDGDGDDNKVWVMSLDEILGAKNGDSIKLTASFKPENRSAYCLVDGEYLWVGEFRDPEKYLTDATHEFDVAGDVNNYAIICAYRIDQSSENGLASDTPEMIVSVRDLTQGFVRTDRGEFVLSTSYGLSSSVMYIYENVLEGEADSKLTVNGTDVPVWYLDEDSLVKSVEMPPMSEEMVYKDGRIYVLFESACHKYIFGNFTRGVHIYSYKAD